MKGECALLLTIVESTALASFVLSDDLIHIDHIESYTDKMTSREAALNENQASDSQGCCPSEMFPAIAFDIFLQ